MPGRTALISLFAAIVASVAPQSIAADWADPAKILRIAFPIDVSGLDPAGTQETYASLVEQKIFDALYVWDYLARPYRFVPSVATGTPAGPRAFRNCFVGASSTGQRSLKPKPFLAASPPTRSACNTPATSTP